MLTSAQIKHRRTAEMMLEDAIAVLAPSHRADAIAAALLKAEVVRGEAHATAQAVERMTDV